MYSEIKTQTRIIRLARTSRRDLPFGLVRTFILPNGRTEAFNYWISRRRALRTIIF